MHIQFGIALTLALVVSLPLNAEDIPKNRAADTVKAV